MEYFVKFYQCVVVTSLERHRVTVWTLIWWHLLLCGPPQVEDFLRIALSSLGYCPILFNKVQS
jgi:hypothetical protein